MQQNHMRLMTAGDVAKRFDVSPKTIARWANTGMLPVESVTMGGHRRYSPEAVETIAARLKAQANRTPEADGG